MPALTKAFRRARHILNDLRPKTHAPNVLREVVEKRILFRVIGRRYQFAEEIIVRHARRIDGISTGEQSEMTDGHLIKYELGRKYLEYSIN